MAMKLSNEKKIQTLEYDIDLNNEEAGLLREYGLKRIQEDEDALINYAINRVLFDMSQNLEENIEKMKKIVENKRKTKKN